MEVIFLANSSNNDIQKALREALTSGLGDFLLQEPASSQNGSENTKNSRTRGSNNQQARSGKSGNKQSKGKQNNNESRQSRSTRTGSSSSSANSILNLFRQRLIQRLGGEIPGRSGRAGSRKARRS